MATRPIKDINNRNQTGKDATLSSGNRDLPITNFDWDDQFDNSTSEYNDRYAGYTGYTTVTHTGSFEWSGDIPRNTQVVLRKNGVPRNNLRLRYRTANMTYRWREVKIENYTGDAPNDDIVGRTVNWKADMFRYTTR